MKRLLIPIVALLAFSTLCASVSAPVPEYYAARYYGYARGYCLVFEEELGSDGEPTASGEGRLRIHGSALAIKGPGYYMVNKPLDPNTWVWTHVASYMKASWNSEKLSVHLWASSKAAAGFNDTTNTFIMQNLTFFGHYRAGALQGIRGTAHIAFEKIGGPGEEVLCAAIMLYIGTEHFRTFVWLGEEVPELPPDSCLARWFRHRVTV